MSSHPDDDGNSDADGKTRLVIRSDSSQRSGFPAAGNATHRSASVIGTTRLVSIQPGTSAPPPLSQPGATMRMEPPQFKTQFVRGTGVDRAPVAGWIVVVKGPGRGDFRPVFVGMNTLGRAPNQRIPVDFGDETISREEHAFITYDDEQRTFYLHHGGKANLIRLGEKPLLEPTELKTHDEFRIGNTTFRFFSCCGPDFDWSEEGETA